jgi:hypothetical protein
MKSMNEEIEEIVDKHIKNPRIFSDEAIDVVKSCAFEFGGPEQALAASLIALAHSLKHCSQICHDLDDETAFLKVTADPFVKMVMPWAYALLTCKRMK